MKAFGFPEIQNRMLALTVANGGYCNAPVPSKLVPGLSMLGPPGADLFYKSFLKNFRCFARFPVSFLGPFLVPKNWASESGLNMILIVWPNLGPIFGTISGTQFWAPKLHKKRKKCRTKRTHVVK